MENIELSISLIDLDIEVSIPVDNLNVVVVTPVYQDLNIVFTVGEAPVIVDVPSDSTALFNLANELQDTGLIIDSQTYNLS